MLDVTFNESLAASLHNVARLDVLALPLELQLGQLSRFDDPTDPFWPLRANALPIAPAANRDLYPTDREWYVRVNESTVALDDAIAASEPLRIWVDDGADARIGLAWLCARTQQTRMAVQCVHLPNSVAVTAPPLRFMQYASMGEREPTSLAGEAKRAVTLTQPERRAWALEWDRLRSDNAPLRAVINGNVVSVPVDFYDDLLRAVYRPGANPVATIGAALGAYPIGVPDWWWAHRLRVITGETAE